MSYAKFLAVIPLLCTGCAGELPYHRIDYREPPSTSETHLVWCEDTPNNCYSEAYLYCNGEWHAVAVGTNLPAMVKQGSGYYFWIACGN